MQSPIQNNVVVIIAITIRLMNQKAAVDRFTIQKKLLFILLISILGSAD